MASTSLESALRGSAFALLFAVGCVSDRHVDVKKDGDAGTGGSDASVESGNGSGGSGGSGGAAAGGSGGLPAQGGGGAGGEAGATGDGSFAGSDAGDSGAPADPDGYVRSGSWQGWSWTQTSAGASVAPASFVEMPLCASGTVPPTIDASAFARVGVNLNQAAGPGTPPIKGVVPTEAGVVVSVTNKGGSPLLLEAISNITGDSWCLPLLGDGGFYPWSSFVSHCMTPGGPAYSGKQAITGLAIKVPGNADTQVPFDLCLAEFREASSGPVGSCIARNPPCSPALIDDFEGEPVEIYEQDGRSGHWAVYHDFTNDAGAPTVIFQSSPGHESAHAIESKGSGYTDWGTGIGARLNSPPGALRSHAYDASRYAGFRFWYMSKTPLSLRVKTLDTTSKYDTFIEGGNCSLSVGQCALFYAPLAAAASWTEVQIAWEDIVQAPWSPIPNTVFDPKSLVEIRFETIANDDFDYLVDDLTFY